MRTISVWAISVALLAAAAGLKLATAAQRPGAAFIAGDQPVSEEQVRTKLLADGWSDIRIERNGKFFGVTAVKDGQPGKLAIDSQTGRLHDNDDDDDD